MGGIQVDADEMVKRLKEKDKGYGPGTPEGAKKENEELANFFRDLLEKGKGRGSPRVTGGGGRREGSGDGGGTPKRGGSGGE